MDRGGLVGIESGEEQFFLLGRQLEAGACEVGVGGIDVHEDDSRGLFVDVSCGHRESSSCSGAGDRGAGGGICYQRVMVDSDRWSRGEKE